MSTENYKKMHVKLVAVCIFSSLIILSGCTSTEKKSSTNEITPTNQQKALITKAPIETAPKKTAPKKAAPKKVAPIKASTKNESKVTQLIESEQKLTVKNPPKKSEAKLKKNIESSEIVKKPLPLPVISLNSLNQLPLSLSDNWVITIKKSPLATSEECVLYHEKNGIFDGYKDNNIKVYLTLSKLLVKSDSNFDLSYPDTGVYIENKDNKSSFYPLTLSSQITIASLALPLRDYIESSSKNLVVKSGFWPSWPITETSTVMFPLNEVDSMVETLNTCISLLDAS